MKKVISKGDNEEAPKESPKEVRKEAPSVDAKAMPDKKEVEIKDNENKKNR